MVIISKKRKTKQNRRKPRFIETFDYLSCGRVCVQDYIKISVHASTRFVFDFVDYRACSFFKTFVCFNDPIILYYC